MAKISRSTVENDLRARVFAMIANGETEAFQKVNDRQQGIILTDLNNIDRYIRVGVIVAEEREDMTAQELMAKEIADYQDKQEKKKERAVKAAAKAERDKAKREKDYYEAEDNEE